MDEINYITDTDQLLFFMVPTVIP